MRLAAYCARVFSLTRGATLAAALGMVAVGVKAQAQPAIDDLLARAGDRVAEYYRRAESIVCMERVTVQPIVGSDMRPNGFARVLDYELRVDWEPSADGDAPDANVVRELKRINGRPARPKDEPKCMDPRAISPEPLGFMLPRHRDEYVFSWLGAGLDRKRSVFMMSYQSRIEGHEQPEVTRKDDCTSFSVPAAVRGRVWLDPVTYDILRVDQGLKRQFEVRVPYKIVRYGESDSFVVERLDSSIRYRPIVFHDPDEVVLLPESIESLMVVRGDRVGNRTTQTFSDYKRFVTGARIVK
jgi:hypothetical protein